jgi:D-alanine-D-alanine ligase
MEESLKRKNIAVLLGDLSLENPSREDRKYHDEDREATDRLKEALAKIPGYNFFYLENHCTYEAEFRDLKLRANLALNFCDTGFFNDSAREGEIPRMLEAINVPYSGSGEQCMQTCFDKSLVKSIAAEMGIRVPRSYIFGDRLRYPIIVKPRFGDGSLGMEESTCVVRRRDQLKLAIQGYKNFGYARDLLFEEFLEGKELTVGVIGNGSDYKVLPIAEEDFSLLPKELPPIVGYRAKWDPDSLYWKLLKSKRAELPERLEKTIIESSLRLINRLGCKDYTRVDWRLDSSGVPRLLEVNPNPGWCWDGHLAKMAQLANISYSGMLEMILKAAEKRLFGK